MNKLGAGTTNLEKYVTIFSAFGTVYKGNFKGQLVAVKQLSENFNEQSKTDFEGEINLMFQIKNHTNVVGLIGICYSPTLSLVFCVKSCEFM